MRTTTIGMAARAAGVGVETVRFYERKGLIDQPAKPSNGGLRDYPPHTVRRIRFIREAQGLGFSLREIDELLSLRADPAADCGQVRERAQIKLAEVDCKIAQLGRVRSALAQLIDACPGKGGLQVCSIMDALERAETTRRSQGDNEHG